MPTTLLLLAMTMLLLNPTPWKIVLLVNVNRQYLSIDPTPKFWNFERINVKPLTPDPILGKEAVSLRFDVFRLIAIQERPEDEYSSKRTRICRLHRALSSIQVVRMSNLEVHGLVFAKRLLANAVDKVIHYTSIFLIRKEISFRRASQRVLFGSFAGWHMRCPSATNPS